MQLVDSALNNLRGNTAVALRAAADGSNSVEFLFRSRHLGVKPSVSVVGHPTMLAVDRGNPHAGLFVSVNNQQRPLRFKLIDVDITNGDGIEGIDYNKVIFSKNQLGSQPKTDCRHCDDRSHHQVADGAFSCNGVKEKLSKKQSVEGKGAESPNQVAFRLKDFDFSHLSIIAGQSLNKEGTQK